MSNSRYDCLFVPGILNSIAISKNCEYMTDQIVFKFFKGSNESQQFKFKRMVVFFGVCCLFAKESYMIFQIVSFLC